MFQTFVFSDVPYFLASSKKWIWNVGKLKVPSWWGSFSYVETCSLSTGWFYEQVCIWILGAWTEYYTNGVWNLVANVKQLHLGHLKSQITFHPFFLLYDNYTLHHSYYKTTKTDREKDSKLLENIKTKGCGHSNLFQEKFYFHEITIIYNYEKRDYIYTRSYDNQILSYNWFISASTSKRNSFENKTPFLKWINGSINILSQKRREKCEDQLISVESHVVNIQSGRIFKDWSLDLQ